MSSDTPAVRHTPVERVLAFMVAGTIGVSILAIVAILIGTAVGVTGSEMGQGAWPIVFLLPMVGLPIGLLLMIAFIVLSSIRRGREAREGQG